MADLIPFDVHRFVSNAQLVPELGAAICHHLRHSIAKRGLAVIAVSGGNSPKPLFEFLSHQELDWSKVMVTLVDERWVNEQHPDSNAKLVRDYLLQHHASRANFIGLYNGASTPFLAEDSVNETLLRLPLPFTVVVLGMGEDGHTASFFPGAAQLSQALDSKNQHRCCAIKPLTAPHQRMTLTLSTLLNTENLYLHITGKQKLSVLDQALRAFDPIKESRIAYLQSLPVRAALHQDRSPIHIYCSE